jgi:hypothetical protein
MVTSVSHSTANGVRVYQADLPGVCYGTLVFGVGMRDEPVTLSGITHLMEHLLLRLMEPISIEHDAVVDDNSLTVYASGPVDEVGQFLTDFTKAIGRLGEVTEQDLKFEKRIIGIEHPSDFNAPTAGLLTYRYGLHGVGMANFGAPSTIDMTRQDVIEWAALWLCQNNTTVAFTKPLQATLDLQLLPGTVARPEQSKALVTTPTLVASSKGGVALSLIVPRSDVDLLQIALEHELFMSLRHRRGLIYGIETFTTPVDGKVSELVFVLDPERNHIDTVVRVIFEIVREITTAGFSQAAVDRARLHGSARAQRTFAGLDYLDRLAEDALHGWPTRSPEQMNEDATAVTPESLTEILLGVAASVIIAYDEDVSLSKKTLRSLPVPVTRFTLWQRGEDHLSRAAIRSAESKWHGKGTKETLIVTDSALFKVKEARTRRILFEDIVMVGDRPCGCLVLVDYWGRSVEFQAENWKRMKSLKRRLLEILDPALVRAFPKH